MAADAPRRILHPSPRSTKARPCGGPSASHLSDSGPASRWPWSSLNDLTSGASKDIFRNMPFEGPRELTDPRAMRAMAHPVRLALMEALNHHGQLTATEAAEHVGESPSNCSFHLRQLAKYGFVEEAEGGTGRRRPWRVGERRHAVHRRAGGRRDTRWRPARSPVSSRSAGSRARVREWSSASYLPEEWRAVTGIGPDDALRDAGRDEGAQRPAPRAARAAIASGSPTRRKRPEGSRPIEHIAFYYPVDP